MYHKQFVMSLLAMSLDRGRYSKGENRMAESGLDRKNPSVEPFPLYLAQPDLENSHLTS